MESVDFAARSAQTAKPGGILQTTSLWLRTPVWSDNGRGAAAARQLMLTAEQIQTIHQLYYAERWPIRKIERHLRMGWRTIRKYLEQPDQPSTLLPGCVRESNHV
jgi:hypothetical protein